MRTAIYGQSIDDVYLLKIADVILDLVRFLRAAYTEIGGDEELPLGEEFQEHLRRFLRPNEKKVQKRVELVQKLVSQLS